MNVNVNVMQGGLAVDLDVGDILRDVLNLSVAQVGAVVDEGINSVEDLANWEHDDIKSWADGKRRLPANRGHVNFGIKAVEKLQGLSFWAMDMKRRGKDVRLRDFDEGLLYEMIAEAKVENKSKNQDSEVPKPEKFNYAVWPEWEKSVYNYFGAKLNARGVPMSYVIRKDEVPQDMEERTMELIYNASLAGAQFRRDSAEVLAFLKSLVIGTEAENWIGNAKCGRVLMSNLQTHYDGKAEGERRRNVAVSDLTSVFYKHESTFPFNTFINRLKKCFDTLEECGVPKHETEKVELLLDKIQCTHPEIKNQVSQCRNTHGNSFEDASVFLAGHIARVFPKNNPHSQSYNGGRGGRSHQRNISFAGRHGRGRGRGRSGHGGRGGRGGRHSDNVNNGNQNGNIVNGVDASDTTRYYSKQEWAKLDFHTRKRILDDPTRKSKRGKSISALVSSDEGRSVIASVMTELLSNQDDSSNAIKGDIVFDNNNGGPRHGSRVSAAGSILRRSGTNNGSTNNDNRSTTSSVTWDHLGNRSS
jgi:hypothetical protein